MADIPQPLITCLLPDYEDKHCQWLIWQYLESSGFTHTLSAFSLELNLRGIKSEQFTHIDEGDLRQHFSCLLTKRLVGPSVAVRAHSGSSLPLLPGVANNQAPTAEGVTQQLLVNDPLPDTRAGASGSKQPSAAAAGNGRSDIKSSKIADHKPRKSSNQEQQRQPNFQQQTRQVDGGSNSQQKPPAFTAEQPHISVQQETSAHQVQLQREVAQQRIRRRSSVSDQQSQLQQHQQPVTSQQLPPISEAAPDAAAAAGTPLPPSADAAAVVLTASASSDLQTIAADKPAPAATAVTGKAAAAHSQQPAASHVLAAAAQGIAPIDSLPVDVDDLLDFGDDEEDGAAGAPAAVHHSPPSLPATAAAGLAEGDVEMADANATASVQEQQQCVAATEEEEHLLSGITEAIGDENDAKHRQEDQAAGPAAKALQAVEPRQKPPLKRGPVPIPHPSPVNQSTAAPAKPTNNKSRSNSRDSRSRGRSRGPNSRARSRSRDTRSHSRDRGRSRSRGRHHSTSRSRTRASRSRSRRRSSSRSRSRGRRYSRTRSPCSRSRSSARNRSRDRHRRGASISPCRRARSRDSRSRSGTRSRSPARDASGGRGSYQGSWQRKNSGDNSGPSGQQQWQKSRQGPVYTNIRHANRSGYTTNQWSADRNDSREYKNTSRSENGASSRGRGGRTGSTQQRDSRGIGRGMGNRRYSGGQYGQYGDHDRNQSGGDEQHVARSMDRTEVGEQQHQQQRGGSDGLNSEQVQLQHPEAAAAAGPVPSALPPPPADAAGQVGDTSRGLRGGRSGGAVRGRGRGRGVAGSASTIATAAAASLPGQDNTAADTAGAGRVLGKEGGKYDWPPRDGSGQVLQTVVLAPAAATSGAHPRPMVRKHMPTAVADNHTFRHRVADAAASAAASTAMTGGTTVAPPSAAVPHRQSVFQRLSYATGGGVGTDGASNAAAGSPAAVVAPAGTCEPPGVRASDRWQPGDEDLGAAAAGGGGGGGSGSTPLGSPSGGKNKHISPKKHVSPRGGASGGGHTAVVKRKLGPAITDLSMESSAGGASPVSVPMGEAPLKKPRASSPAEAYSA